MSKEGGGLHVSKEGGYQEGGRMKKERGADSPFHVMEPGSLKADAAVPFQHEHLFLGKVGGKTKKNDLIYCS